MFRTLKAQRSKYFQDYKKKIETRAAEKRNTFNI